MERSALFRLVKCNVHFVPVTLIEWKRVEMHEAVTCGPVCSVNGT